MLSCGGLIPPEAGWSLYIFNAERTLQKRQGIPLNFKVSGMKATSDVVSLIYICTYVCNHCKSNCILILDILESHNQLCECHENNRKSKNPFNKWVEICSCDSRPGMRAARGMRSAARTSARIEIEEITFLLLCSCHFSIRKIEENILLRFCFYFRLPFSFLPLSFNVLFLRKNKKKRKCKYDFLTYHVI